MHFDKLCETYKYSNLLQRIQTERQSDFAESLSVLLADAQKPAFYIITRVYGLLQRRLRSFRLCSVQ